VRVIVADEHDPACSDNGLSHQQGSQILEDAMKVTYDPEVDVLRILFSNAPIEESDEDKPGIIIDYDKDGNVVGMEILDASKRMDNPRAVDYAVMRCL
jgi:uncharacterized protein YuzE